MRFSTAIYTHVSSTLKASLRFSALVNAIMLKNLIRKGIPAVLRPKVWFSLSGVAKKKSTVPESYYNDLIKAVESTITPATRQIDQFICEDVEDCKAKTWSWRISCSDFRTILAEDTAACSIRVEMLFICYQRDGHILAHILAATSIGVISATAFHYYHRQMPQKQLEDQTVVPLLDRNKSGCVAKLEKFSNYVARQIGFLVMVIFGIIKLG
ncbi:uncharacterized protein LOC114319116 [Camellia sinensis]|uniref:uncharacterized protein LOC114319116 n=1 Tax=Camellia sinensis TaxID=4442 RepID=UPI001036B3C0|nr:uncharacterized protein LOC114319116 [Camellia sinensis]